MFTTSFLALAFAERIMGMNVLARWLPPAPLGQRIITCREDTMYRNERSAARVGGTSGANGNGAGQSRSQPDYTSSVQGRQSHPVRRSDGKVIGHVRNGVFRKRLRASRHFLRVPPAIAFDVESLVEAEQAGAGVIRIEDADSARVYAATMADVRRRGFVIERGHGAQLAVPLGAWRVSGSDVPEQLRLFKGLR